MQYKILFLCDFNRKSANTIVDHATCFEAYSKHKYYYYNPVRKNKPVWLDLNDFDIIIIHYSIYVLGDYYINETWRNAIAESKAVKVQFIQDEYRTINAFHERMRELSINVLFTCFPEREIEKVYPEDKLPGVVKINNLTGYVPNYMENKRPDFDKKRSIDVGYRGRELGYWYGDLGREKLIIATKMRELLKDSGLIYDISAREEDRIYGSDWINFLCDCRCTLGTESGASVMDFTGEIEHNVKRYCKENPNATYEEVKEKFFKDVDGKIYLNQISPRAFEAIGCGSCLVMFEGEYSGILKPGVHYIALKKDFSNIAEVIELMKDEKYTRDMAVRAYEDVIASGKYSYKAFVEFFDNKIEDYMADKNIRPAIADVTLSLGRVLKSLAKLSLLSIKYIIKSIVKLLYKLYRFVPFFIKHRFKLFINRLASMR